MYKAVLCYFLFIVYSATGIAQVNATSTNFPDRKANTEEEDVVRMSALETFKAAFSPQPSGILHVYLDPTIDPAEVYLFKGEEADGTTKALLPTKFQRLAKRLGAKIYATKAINLRGTEDLYLVRLDGIYEDRIELFAINGYEVEHVRTMAYYSCIDGKCTQQDTWITDIDGDTDAELIEISRVFRGDETTVSRKAVYTVSKKGKWKKSKQLAAAAPWNTVTFFEQ